MPHPLQSTLGSLVRKVRLLWLVHGLAWLVAFVLGLATLLILCDYLVRVEDQGIRVMFTGALVLTLAWTLYRCVWMPLRIPLAPLDVALRLESRLPALAGRLSSSIQFLSEPPHDPRAGSDELRRLVIHDATQAMQEVDLGDAIDQRPIIRALFASLTVALLAAALFAWQPRLAVVGAQRLVRPFSNERWPQAHYLVLRHRVERVASGQAFEIEVVDQRGAKLPSEIWMIYQHAQPDGSFVEEREALPILGDVAVARREHVTRPFAYRVVGGDDNTMPWTFVQVVEPPALADLEMTLHYPTYTGLPAGPSERQLRAITGARVSLLGKVNKPVRTAKVVHEDGREISLALNEAGTEFSLSAESDTPLVVDKTGAYWFEFVDFDGLIGGPEVRYEMRAIPDLAPSVTIDTPAASSFATPNATIPVKITATDDLAIRQIALGFLRSDQSDQGEQSLVIYEGPATPPPPPLSTAARRDQGERLHLEHRWDLNALGLTPGVQLTFQATAVDYQPAVGHSTPRHLTIVEPDELERRLEERHAFLLAELNRVLKFQRSSRQHLAAVQIQGQQVRQFGQADIERLQAAEMDQRQVDRSLASRGDGLRAQLRGVLTDIENNQLDNPEIKRRTEAIEQELARIERELLPRIEQALTSSQKRIKANRSGDASPLDDTIAGELNDAGRHQDQVIFHLEHLLGGLSQWDSQRRLVRELSDLHDGQQELTRRTAQLGRETLAKRTPQLTSQQQADLKKLAAEQHELARRLDSVQQNMRRAVGQLEPDDPLAAQAIADATAKAGEAATAGKMRQAGANIDSNQIGQAAARQQSVADDLQEMLDILSHRREHELARLVKKLREAERELAQLREQHANLRKQLDQLSGPPTSDGQRQQLQRLADGEHQLEVQATRMARKLERLQAEQAAGQLSKAGSSMASASSQGQQGQASQARDSASAAQRQLDAAQSQLAEARRQAERDLAHEQFAKMRDQISALRDRQEGALQESQRLQGLRTAAGQLTTAQRTSLANAAAVQEELATSTEALARKLAIARVFALALDAAAGDMKSAMMQLRAGATDQTTTRFQQQALSRLDYLVTSLAADEEDLAAAKQSPQADSGGNAGDGGPPGEQIPDLAQIKLIKLLQQDLNQRTNDLAQRLASTAKLNEVQLQELRSVANEQQSLAEFMRELSPSPGPSPGATSPADTDTPADNPLPEIPLEP